MTTITYTNAYSIVTSPDASGKAESAPIETHCAPFSLLRAAATALAMIGRPISAAFASSLADDRAHVMRLAQSVANTDPGFAADLRAAAARDF